MADDDQELYDEFGNYIGPDLDSSDDEDDDDDSDREETRNVPDDASDVSADDDDDDRTNKMLVERDENAPAPDLADPVDAIVLHEDKTHYPSAQEVYGEEVRTAVLDEDAMDLDVPLVEPVSTKSNRTSNNAKMQTDYVYNDEYLTALFGNETTRVRRGVAIVGHLHSGKTSFCDLLLEKTLKKGWGPRASLDANEGGAPRWLDTLESEQSRQMSLVSTPVTTVLPDTRGKSHVLTMIDCPGHPNFHDESVAALRVVDGVTVVVDAVEGIMMHTEMVVKQAIAEGLPITLLIHKMDRLLVELKLPPRDAYFKLQHLVDSFNELVGQVSKGRYPKISPERGNVAFASSQHGWCFTLESYAQLYLDHLCESGLGDNLGSEDLARRLWGDAYLDPVQRTFHHSPRDCTTPGVERTFVSLVLEPLYKLYTACLGEREKDVAKMLRTVGVLLSKEELRASARPLLRSALSRFFDTATNGFVDMIVKHV